MDETPEKKVAISKVDAGKYLAQCRLCGTWIEVHPVIGQDKTIKFWEADFGVVKLSNQLCFSLYESLLNRAKILPQAGGEAGYHPPWVRN